ncbi:hypothetical protein A4X13_0g1784 [Tilletia indica]|uniref:Uncharacterized protein n=1 Tax=Tilletia indica TaxID=43049 RepID=A0A177TPR0_9BASI|nr:hypothetical protein A4X13_0g1784 [Tilletia indica]
MSDNDLFQLTQHVDNIFIDNNQDGDGQGDPAPASEDQVEAPREARIRRAIEQAKKNFEPVREDDSWFLSQELVALLGAHVSQSHQATEDLWIDSKQIQLENQSLYNFLRKQLQIDKRASHKLDWSLSALYANSCPRAALTLATALLRTTTEWSTHLSDLDTPVPSTDLSTWALPSVDESQSGTKAKKARSKEVQFSFPKEASDVVLHGATKILASDSSSFNQDEARKLALRIASRLLPQLPHDGLREAIWDGSEERPDGWKAVHWTNTPGITLSMGHLCSRLKHWRAATLAYAMYVGLRGPVRIVSRCTAIALSHLATSYSSSTLPEARQACITLAQVFAGSYIGATQRHQRLSAIQEVREGRVIPLEFLPTSTSIDERDGQDVLRALLSSELMHPESAIALVRCGPARNTTLGACVKRLDLFLSGTGEVIGAAEDEDDGAVQIRSVRTL